MHNTILRNYNWRSDLSLWKKTVISFPTSPRAHYNLGIAYSHLGLIKEAQYQLFLSRELKEAYNATYKSIKDELLKTK